MWDLIWVLFPYGGVAIILLGDYFDKRNGKNLIMDILGISLPMIILISPFLIRLFADTTNTSWLNLIFLSNSALCLLSGVIIWTQQKTKK